MLPFPHFGVLCVRVYVWLNCHHLLCSVIVVFVSSLTWGCLGFIRTIYCFLGFLVCTWQLFLLFFVSLWAHWRVTLHPLRVVICVCMIVVTIWSFFLFFFLLLVTCFSNMVGWWLGRVLRLVLVFDMVYKVFLREQVFM